MSDKTQKPTTPRPLGTIPLGLEILGGMPVPAPKPEPAK